MRSFAACSDGQLLRDARRDPEAFGEVYRRHEAIVVAFLVRRTGDLELTADLTAETFAVALLRSHTFRDAGDPAIGWLLGIADRLLLRYWRKGRAERRARTRLGIEAVVLSQDSSERLKNMLDPPADDHPLMIALSRLPADQRAAIRAHVLDERPYRELASQLGVPESTVRQRVSRGLRRLRQNPDTADR